MSAARRAELAPVIDAAQRAAGVLAARGRGDREGARDLMRSFSDDRELATGALMVGELALGLLAHESGQSVDEVVERLCVDLEAAIG